MGQIGFLRADLSILPKLTKLFHGKMPNHNNRTGKKLGIQYPQQSKTSLPSHLDSKIEIQIYYEVCLRPGVSLRLTEELKETS